MGLDKAKSLLNVKDDYSFLDLTAKQIISMREKFESPIKFLLMNSFNTSADTISFLKQKYSSSLSSSGAKLQEELEFVQNKVPKVDKSTMAPAENAINPQLEWCPPGHGDLYTALYGEVYVCLQF